MRTTHRPRATVCSPELCRYHRDFKPRTRSRALIKEIKAITNPTARQELLRERFIEAVDRLAGVRALVGIRASGGCDIGGSRMLRAVRGSSYPDGSLPLGRRVRMGVAAGAAR